MKSKCKISLFYELQLYRDSDFTFEPVVLYRAMFGKFHEARRFGELAENLFGLRSRVLTLIKK